MPTHQLTADNPNGSREEPTTARNFAKTPSPRRLLNLEDTPQDDSRSPEEDVDARRQREEADSLELARQLMAEEAMASYQQSWGMLNQSRDNLSTEDYEALQAVLQEDEQEEIAELEDDEGELSYETMLQLGERIGDVKTERWTMQAKKVIDKLPSFCFEASNEKRAQDVDDSEIKCLVCQCEYEDGEKLCRLPCSHCFHASCSTQWLMEKDACPYCRQSIVERK
jgi:E3 ubiquitin-protein ligase BIG BROTHER-like protein